MTKICPFCGKDFAARKGQIYCSGVCAGRASKGRKQDNTPVGERGRRMVEIRITKSLPVYTALRPEVGRVYWAEAGTGSRGEKFYCIRGIGPLGLTVRRDECVEVAVALPQQ